MRARTSAPKASPAPSITISPQDTIPWWNDVTPTVRAELELPPVRDVVLADLDVVVIGAGVTGLSAALGVKERDPSASVLILEKEVGLGYGATGRNAGILTVGINMGMSELASGSPGLDFWPATTVLFHQLIEEAAASGALLSAQQTGALSLAESTRTARKLEREARVRVEGGLKAEVWTPAQVAEATQGRLNVQSVVNALWLADEGRQHPLTLLAHLARRARRDYQVLIAGQAAVQHYEVRAKQGYRWHITLADGSSFLSRGLINCVGPIVGANARIFALAFGGEFPDTFPVFWDAASYTYADYRPGNGRLGVSGGRYGKAGVSRYDAGYYKRLMEMTRHWLPELVDQEPTHAWAVDLAVSADMIPQLRALGEKAPGFAIEGLGAQGVLPGMLLGRQAGISLVDQL